MKNNFFSATKAIALFATAGLLATSCSKNDDGGNNVEELDTSSIFHVAYGLGYSGNASCALQHFTDLSKGDITFEGKGFQLKPARNHSFISIEGGANIYNLEYGLGNVMKYEPISGENIYDNKLEINIKDIIGTTHPRWGKISADNALTDSQGKANHVKDANGNYTHTEVTIDFLDIKLSDLSFTAGVKTVTLPQESGETFDNVKQYYISRIGAPILLGNKVYIGTTKTGYDGSKTVGLNNNFKSSTLVLDYPSLTNPKIIKSEVGKGSNYGYRTPSMTVYNNAIYQVTESNTKILRIVNEAYDNTYDFDLATALGMEKVGATGIFYAGNGIAYVPFYDGTKGSGADKAAWGIARVDLNAKTAIKMNTPDRLWLRYMQSAKLGKDGKLYMALCPVDATGNIYIFDPTKADANGFEKGASLTVSGEGFYLGIF